MGAIFNGQEIGGAMFNGSVLFEEPDWSKTWSEVPDTGITGQDFKGQLFMTWDAETGVGTFMGYRVVRVKTYTNPLLIELPTGFTFDVAKCPTKMTFYNELNGVNSGNYSGKLTYSGNKCYGDARPMLTNYDGINVSPWFPLNSVYSRIKFNLIKED